MNPIVERSLLVGAGLVAGWMAAAFWLSRQEADSGQAAAPAVPPSVISVPAEIAPPPTQTASPTAEASSQPSDDPAAAELAQREFQLSIGLARAFYGFLIYAQEHEGRLPDSLDELPLRYFKGQPPVILDPVTQKPLPLEYTAGLTTSDSSQTLVLATAPLHNGKRWVSLLDGSVHIVDEQEYQSRIKSLPPLEEPGQ